MAKKYIYSEAKVLKEFVGALLKNLIVNRKSKSNTKHTKKRPNDS